MDSISYTHYIVSMSIKIEEDEEGLVTFILIGFFPCKSDIKK